DRAARIRRDGRQRHVARHHPADSRLPAGSADARGLRSADAQVDAAVGLGLNNNANTTRITAAPMAGCIQIFGQLCVVTPLVVVANCPTTLPDAQAPIK